MLDIRPQTSIERKLLFMETLINLADGKVTKVSPNSVLDGISGGVSKIASKAEKDIILAVSQLFPDSTSGAQLDQVSLNFGVASRFPSSGSSVYLRVVADPGTIYNQTLHIFQSTSGIQFQLEDSTFTVGVYGWGYIKVRSLVSGKQTNVGPLSITQVTPAPVGHKYVINEVQAIGGRDLETDEIFRIRIKDGANILARGPLAMLEQKFMSINSKVLKCYYNGITNSGKVRISIVTQNGMNLSNIEISQLLTESQDYFTFTEMRPFGTQFFGVELVNINWQPFDISFRLDYEVSVNLDDIRIEIQSKISKYIDFRFFDPAKQRVEWDNLLEIVKSCKGVKYVPDQYFFPNIDIAVDLHRLPRLRGFLMLDLDGDILQNFAGTLSPIYYPSNPDFSYQQTVLNNL